MMPKFLSRIGTGSSSKFKIDMEELLDDTTLPFYDFIEDDKEVYSHDFRSVVEAKEYRCRKAEQSKKKPKDDSGLIVEATRNELVRGADAARKKRAKSKNIIVHYKGVMNTRGWIVFNTTSQYTVGKSYTQYIKLNEINDIKHFKEFKERDIVRLFMSGDISIHCTCPDYRYRFKYMAHNMGYGIFKENRFPNIRNPKLNGTVCKHCLAVLAVYNFNWASIAKDMTRTKYWKKRLNAKISINKKKK